MLLSVSLSAGSETFPSLVFVFFFWFQCGSGGNSGCSFLHWSDECFPYPCSEQYSFPFLGFGFGSSGPAASPSGGKTFEGLLPPKVALRSVASEFSASSNMSLQVLRVMPFVDMTICRVLRYFAGSRRSVQTCMSLSGSSTGGFQACSLLRR